MRTWTHGKACGLQFSSPWLFPTSCGKFANMCMDILACTPSVCPNLPPNHPLASPWAYVCMLVLSSVLKRMDLGKMSIQAFNEAVELFEQALWGPGWPESKVYKRECRFCVGTSPWAHRLSPHERGHSWRKTRVELCKLWSTIQGLLLAGLKPIRLMKLFSENWLSRKDYTYKIILELYSGW